jgi:hypothetical protein
MFKKIKRIFKLLLPNSILQVLEENSKKKKIQEWIDKGKYIPPPDVVKQDIICNYQKKYNYSVLIETGTYKGDMVYSQKSSFKKIISIELGLDLFENAKKRFEKDKSITIYQGDSGDILPKILKEIQEPAIFWLDGHYSGGITAKGNKICPIFEEIDAIFGGMNYNHILLIDDARDFNGFGDYPTVEKLTNYILSKNKDYIVEVKDDIIRYVI